MLYYSTLGLFTCNTYMYVYWYDYLLLTTTICAGEFGAVYKGVWKSGGKQVPVAIKTLKVRERIPVVLKTSVTISLSLSLSFSLSLYAHVQ